ncbi:hypothetical protein GCM10027580_28080 [Corynebacterium faecale]|uniref:hypothetical protein n=1 Tax=Corynebacterium faecale TaxID=1758466 RepID=UPI0025B4B4F9|nr:hypothetical protein [Corynebacterium faecale]
MSAVLFTIAPYALIDSVNLLLIGVVLLSRLFSDLRNKISWISISILFGDFVGIVLAGLIAFTVVNRTGLNAQEILESPIFGGALIAVGLLGLIAARSSHLVSSVYKSIRFVGKRKLNAILFAVFTGLVQSLTSIPFWGGILEMNGFNLANVNSLAVLVVYSLMATFAVALVVFYSLVVKSEKTVNTAKIISWGTLLSSVALIGLGILKL